eukprot:6680582-Prymnesium_polylepis.1
MRIVLSRQPPTAWRPSGAAQTEYRKLPTKVGSIAWAGCGQRGNQVQVFAFLRGHGCHRPWLQRDAGEEQAARRAGGHAGSLRGQRRRPGCSGCACDARRRLCGGREEHTGAGPCKAVARAPCVMRSRQSCWSLNACAAVACRRGEAGIGCAGRAPRSFPRAQASPQARLPARRVMRLTRAPTV